MISIQGSSELRRIVVLNPKGGVGKTTMASNLAGYFATTGRKVAIIDMDKQGSSTQWLGKRPAELPVIHGVFAAPDKPGVPVDFSVTLPAEIELAIVDTPAGVSSDDLPKFTVGSHAIIVPVMPSEFDIHAASRLIADLLLVARVSRENRRLGVIANRVKVGTIAFKQLMKFLNRLSIPVIGVMRDSQNYVRTAREGLSIHELPSTRAGKDLKHWESVTEWLEQRLATPLNERDMLHPDSRVQAVQQSSRLNWVFATTVVLVLITTSVLFWNLASKTEADLAVVPTAAVDEAAEEETTAAGLKVPPLSEKAVTVPMKPVESERGGPLLTPSEELTRKWRLSGVSRAGGEYVVLLTDLSGSMTRVVTGNVRVDGWHLKEAGPGYAIFEKDGEEVRLKVSS